MRLIQKEIHYCWFGGKPKPANIQNYIDGWKKILPDYSFREWNESNFDITTAPAYVREAYDAKKYAFVSDYVRINALYRYGGVYLDTDIEIVKPFDELLENRRMVLGFESRESVETAFIACAKEEPLLREFLEEYEGRRFLTSEGNYDMTVINVPFSKLLERNGLNLQSGEYQELQGGSIAVYPIPFFAGFDVENWHVKQTQQTYMIHHMNSSWVNSKDKLHCLLIQMLQKLLGYERYDKWKAKCKGKDSQN